MTTGKTAGDREVVFFFGAGASQDMGLPTMGKFKGKLIELINNVDERKRRDAALAGLCEIVPISDSELAADAVLRKALDLMESSQFPPLKSFDPANLEHLFCFLQMEHELGKQGSKDRLDVLLEALCVILEKSHDMKWNPPEPRVSDDKGYRRLLSMLWDLYGGDWKKIGQPGFSFITTNYDLALEDVWNNELQYGEMKALKERLYDDLWHSRYISIKHDQRKAIREIIERDGVSPMLEDARYGLLGEPSAQLQAYPLLLKLHGSVNWGMCRSCGNVRVFSSGLFNRQLRTPNVLGLLVDTRCERHPETQGVPPDASSEFLYRPLLVPPTWSKSSQSADLRGIWQKAALEIRAARRLVFIGYSMPDTDLHLKYLLATGLSASKTVPPVLVVNYHSGKTAKKDERDTRKRYREALGVRFGDNPPYQYVPKLFAEAMEDIRDFLELSGI